MKKVLCIGSVTTDVIVSPADSVPTPGTLRAVDSVTTHVGGCAANAAIDLGRLGVPAVLCCKVGADSFGDFVEESVRASGADTRGIVRDPAVSTTVSIVCVQSGGERSFLYCPGSTSAFTAADVPDALLEEADIVFIAGAMLLTAFDGEGDAFCAGFLAGMAQGWDFTRCGVFANAVGTHCVMAIGASTGIRPIAEIEAFIRDNAP